MSHPLATLVVDIGQTLLRRTEPGAFHRAVNAIAAAGHAIDAQTRQLVAESVFTADSPETAASAIAGRLSLTNQAECDLRQALKRPDGDAIVLTGAIRLLETATAHGWCVIAATNAARWTPEVPATLATLVSAIVSSSGIGRLKQDRAFWDELCDTHAVDRCRCLVVGDDPVCDYAVPRTAALEALLVGDAVLPLSTLASWIERAGPPPPETMGIFVGRPEEWAGRSIVDAPHLVPWTHRTTRRPVLLLAGAESQSAMLVRRAARMPALVLERGGRSFPPLGWLVSRSDRRPLSAPGDLAAALEARGLSLDHLPLHHRRHLVSLVREARTPETRRARIDSIVDHLSTGERS